MNTKELTQAANKLEHDAVTLREAADILDHAGKEEAPPYQGTRAEQLAAFLASRGNRATRTEIITSSGIPPGTIASLLGTKKKFQKDNHGYWHPKPKAAEIRQPDPQVVQA